MIINWTSPFPKLGMFGVLFYCYSILIRNSCKQTEKTVNRSAVSNLGLHCLSMSQKWDARLIWVKYLLSKIDSCLPEGNIAKPPLLHIDKVRISLLSRRHV